MHKIHKKNLSLFLKAALLFCTSASISQAALNSSTQEDHSKTWKNNLDLDYGMRGASFSEGPDDAQFVQLIFNPKIKLNFNKYFSLRADASFNLVSARQQTRFDSPALNSINANEILFSITPTNKLELSLGAINQEHLDSPMLAQSGLAFIGVIGKYTEKFKNLSLTLKAQYTIPNSTSLESDRTGEEELPVFQTQGFEAIWTPKAWVKVSANVNHFSYSDLPSVVAFNSGRFGNEVFGVNSSESFFAYEFRGFSQSYKADFDFKKALKPFLSLQSVDNFEAPSGRERSQIISTGVDWSLKNLIITPTLSTFYTESDAAPSAYTDARFGRNNREGQIYGLKFDFKNLGFSVETAYVNSDLIEPDPIQNDAQYFEVYVEVANVKF